MMVVITAAAVYKWSQPAPQPPIVETPEPKLVTLGVITYDSVPDSHFDRIANMTISEVNAYAESKGYRYRFDYVKQKTTGIQEALEKGVRDLSQTRGVKIFLGFDESEAMCASLSYAMSNHLILMGVPLIHHDSSALPDDVMFRVAPNLRQIHGVTAGLLEAVGLEAALIISRGDSWGDGVAYGVEEALGEENVVMVRYDQDTTTYTSILESASPQLVALSSKHGAQRTAVVLIGADETPTILREAEQCVGLTSATWVILQESSDPYNVAGLLPDVPQIEASSRRVLTIQMTTLLDNDVFEDLETGYNVSGGNDTLSLIDASFHDSIWVACLSVLEAKTTDAEVLKGVIPGVAENYAGATGIVHLDPNGDRTVDYHVYELKAGVWIKIGEYKAATGGFSFYD